MPTPVRPGGGPGVKTEGVKRPFQRKKIVLKSVDSCFTNYYNVFQFYGCVLIVTMLLLRAPLADILRLRGKFYPRHVRFS
jgi:hypothetical protein